MSNFIKMPKDIAESFCWQHLRQTVNVMTIIMYKFSLIQISRRQCCVLVEKEIASRSFMSSVP